MRAYLTGFFGGCLVVAIGYGVMKNERTVQKTPSATERSCKLPSPKVVEKVVYDDVKCPELTGQVSTANSDEKTLEAKTNDLEGSSNFVRRQLLKEPDADFLKALKAQPVDSDWAYTMENDLRYELSRLLAEKGGSIERLYCRTSACYLELSNAVDVSKFVPFSMDVFRILNSSMNIGIDRISTHHMSPEKGTLSYCVGRSSGDCNFAKVPRE